MNCTQLASKVAQWSSFRYLASLPVEPRKSLSPRIAMNFDQEDNALKSDWSSYEMQAHLYLVDAESPDTLVHVP